MGESSFVNQGQNFAQSVRPPRTGGLLAGIDWVLIGVVVGLTLFGLLMVYSAAPKFAMDLQNPPDFYLKRQLVWAILGILALGAASFVPYQIYRRFSVALMLVTIVLLLLVAFMGDSTLGSTRSFLLGSVRPSELAKVTIILYVSVWLFSKRDVLNDVTFGLLPLGGILGLTFVLIFLQPDLSAAITVVLMGGLLFFLAGGAWRQIIFTIAIATALGFLVITFYDTGRNRVADYLAGLQNPMQASYHVQRSLEAIINGKLFGVGIGMSSTKNTGLPVPPTDSIFAVIAEETGLVGSGIVIIAFLVLLWRGLAIAHNAPDMLGKLIASGITVWIVSEALLNMAVMVGLLPHAGNALPFISYGGSSLTITLGAVGILMNISRMGSEKKREKGGSVFDAVVDLRWRDRRRRVSRPGRPAGTR